VTIIVQTNPSVIMPPTNVEKQVQKDTRPLIFTTVGVTVASVALLAMAVGGLVYLRRKRLSQEAPTESGVNQTTPTPNKTPFDP